MLQAHRAAPTPLAAAGLMLPRWDTGPLWEAARAALNGVEQAQIRVKESLRIVLLSRGAPIKRPIPKLVTQGSGRSVNGRSTISVVAFLLQEWRNLRMHDHRILFSAEYNSSGEGRWARGNDSANMTDRGRVVAFSNELDEYEALIVILERATAALPSKSQEKQLLSPWNDADSKVRVAATLFLSFLHVLRLCINQNCGSLVAKLEAVMQMLQNTLTKVKEVSLDGETALMDGASLMFRGQKKLVEMLSAIISTASALLNGLRETEKAKDSEGLLASFSRLQTSATSLEVPLQPLLSCFGRQNRPTIVLCLENCGTLRTAALRVAELVYRGHSFGHRQENGADPGGCRRDRWRRGCHESCHWTLER
jgi:hypothetical protein